MSGREATADSKTVVALKYAPLVGSSSHAGFRSPSSSFSALVQFCTPTDLTVRHLHPLSRIVPSAPGCTSPLAGHTISRASSPTARHALHACRDSVSATAQDAVRAPHLSSRVIRPARPGTHFKLDNISTHNHTHHYSRPDQLLTITMGSDTAPASEQVAAHDQQQEDPVGTHSARIPLCCHDTMTCAWSAYAHQRVTALCSRALELCHC